MQFYFGASVCQSCYRGASSWMVVTNLGGDFKTLGRIVVRNPIAAIYFKFIPVERKFISNYHAIIQSI